MIKGGINITNIIMFVLSSLIVIFLTLPIHEWAHGFVAYKLGDPTAKYVGRLSLNPLKHIDYIGSLMIILFGFGWAKPVPVNPRYFKNPKRDMAITAFDGPFSNIVIAFISLIFHWICLSFNSNIPVLNEIWLLFYFIAHINISLAVFNLLPIPPLDGSKILSIILPDSIYYKIMQYEQYSFIIRLTTTHLKAVTGTITLSTVVQSFSTTLPMEITLQVISLATVL